MYQFHLNPQSFRRLFLLTMALPSRSDALNAGMIKEGLNTQALGRSIHILTETPSTNTLALTLAESEEPHGTVILAEHQTAGKGRLGRSWISPPHKNIYCSLILRDSRLQKHVTWIPLVTGLALSEAIHTTHTITTSLKWPNDILVGTKKIGGILCESTSRGNTTGALIVGVGVNVNSNQDDFPSELQDHTTSVLQASGQLTNRNTLLACMFNHLEKWYDQLVSHNIDAVHVAYSAACSTLGLHVRCMLTGTREIEGRATAIGRDGALQLTPFEQGVKNPIAVHSADVTHVR
jgi:BirA family biotin operon repressor/biotin-[acetyl-CoA-carboxylase] ligase